MVGIGVLVAVFVGVAVGVSVGVGVAVGSGVGVDVAVLVGVGVGATRTVTIEQTVSTLALSARRALMYWMPGWPKTTPDAQVPSSPTVTVSTMLLPEMTSTPLPASPVPVIWKASPVKACVCPTLHDGATGVGVGVGVGGGTKTSTAAEAALATEQTFAPAVALTSTAIDAVSVTLPSAQL